MPFFSTFYGNEFGTDGMRLYGYMEMTIIISYPPHTLHVQPSVCLAPQRNHHNAHIVPTLSTTWPADTPGIVQQARLRQPSAPQVASNPVLSPTCGGGDRIRTRVEGGLMLLISTVSHLFLRDESFVKESRTLMVKRERLTLVSSNQLIYHIHRSYKISSEIALYKTEFS